MRAARLDRGLTLRDAAERASLSLRFFGDLEAGRANIAVGRLAQVAVALGVALPDLVADDVDAKGRIIVLVGLRGAGKSTVGQRLAGALDIDFIESDDMIEEEAGLSLAEIFALHGESYYRKLETRCLTTLVASNETWVVAVSGGVVHNAAAWEILQRRCTTVWLQASPEDHMQRVLDQGDTRPVRDRENAMAELRGLLEARKAYYGQCDVSVETSGRTVSQALRGVLEQIESLGHTS